MSMRSFPGIDEASYQVSAVLVPSGLYVVLFCVKVMVRTTPDTVHAWRAAHLHHCECSGPSPGQAAGASLSSEIPFPAPRVRQGRMIKDSRSCVVTTLLPAFERSGGK